MKIEFLTQDDPLYVFPFFAEFIPNYASEFEISQISSSPAMGRRSRSQMLRELTQLYGLTGVARLTARLTKAKIGGLLPRSKGASRYYTLAQLCHTYGIPHSPIGNPNSPDFVEAVRVRRPDLLVSVAFPYILKEPL